MFVCLVKITVDVHVGVKVLPKSIHAPSRSLGLRLLLNAGCMFGIFHGKFPCHVHSICAIFAEE